MSYLITDIGNVRKENEDSVSMDENESYSLYIVCDGVGGHNAGEVASKESLNIIVNYIREFFEPSIAENILKNAVLKANDEIYRMSVENEEFSGMGTTVTCALKVSDRCYIAHIGDSGAFMIKGAQIRKITKDHSYVQELVDLGTISEEEMKNHPNKNVITRSLGSNKDVKVDLKEIDTAEFDKCILCSDGLSDYLTKEEMLEIVLSSDNEKETLERMVSLAKDRGGKDNISIVIF